ncbi:glutamate decarboxylase 1-like isoform X1 [Lates japonicus]
MAGTSSEIHSSDLLFCHSHQVAPKIKAMMMESGTTMVGYQPQGNKVNFFRMVVSNPAATQSDIDFLIDEIERLGHDL